MQTENDLLQLLKRSDKKAYETIFRLFYQPLKLFANKLLKDDLAADDIVQEVFVQLWEKRKSFKDIALKPYLYTSVKNRVLNQIRHLQVKQKHIDETKHTSEEFFETKEDDSELKLKIFSSIEKLPEQCKKIFIMNRVHGLKHKEIAEELNISVKTVTNQIGKALKILREELKGAEILILIGLLKLF